MNDYFLDKVSNTIKKYNMFEMSEHLLVCLSGGADSVSLLLCLNKLGYKVIACHVNHNLRGEESNRDQAFCEKLCKSLGIDIVTHSVDVRSYCKQKALSIEEGARELRYEFFNSINADKVCTAHTLSDCLETTIFNLARGTGLKGLCSIPPKRDNIVRPLIRCTREEVEEFLKNMGQDYVTDSTNLSDDYTRNNIRHRVIPVLNEINPSLFKSFEKTIEYLINDQKFLDTVCLDQYKKCCINNRLFLEKLNTLDTAVKERVIMLWLRNNNLNVSNDSVSLVSKTAKNYGQYNISGKTFVKCTKGYMIIYDTQEEKSENADTVIINGAGKYRYANRMIDFSIVDIESLDKDILNVHKKFANCCLDYDKIIGGLVIHKRLEGDSIQLVNREFESSVRKLINKAFLFSQRDNAIILYDDEGPVFVERFGASERVKITQNTKRLLTFKTDDII